MGLQHRTEPSRTPRRWVLLQLSRTIERTHAEFPDDLQFAAQLPDTQGPLPV